jgi:predicted TIM-barrel fold metal-dependent hydrolase
MTAEATFSQASDLLVGELAGLKVVDADTHVSEWHDLWTSRVPPSMRTKVPHVVTADDGTQAWIFNDDDVLHRPAGASSVIRKDGKKIKFWDWDIQSGLGIDEVSVASYDVKERLKVMDQMGVWAQIAYPNLAGFGANRLAKLHDQKLATDIVSIYNDAMGEFQAHSGDRIFPMMLVPYWDINAAVKEIQRCVAQNGTRGITMCSEPHASGTLPDLLDEHWNPLWEVCTDLKLPVNFHVGATDFGYEAFHKGTWPSNDRFRSYVVGCTLLELHSSAVLANLLTSTLLDRYPDIKWVLVESGIGWVPYVLERLEHQLLDSEPEDAQMRLPSPTEQLRKHVYNCFWFEETGPSTAVDRIGADNILFETDYPHPTCLYPSGVPDASALAHGMRVLESWGPEVQRKILSENAAKLYRLPI